LNDQLGLLRKHPREDRLTGSAAYLDEPVPITTGR